MGGKKNKGKIKKDKGLTRSSRSSSDASKASSREMGKMKNKGKTKGECSTSSNNWRSSTNTTAGSTRTHLRKFTMTDIAKMQKYKSALGRGTYSTVERGQWKKQDVALKVYEARHVTYWNTEKEFYEEFKHPHVVDCLGYHEGTQYLYLVLEHMDFTLENKKFDLEWKPTLEVLIQTAKTIDDINNSEGQWIIADLKPDSIMMNKKDEVKLVDFNSVTRVKSMAGLCNNYYAAPETRGNVHPTTDVFSIGTIILEILLGKATGPLKPKKGEESTHVSDTVRASNSRKRFTVCKKLKESGCTGEVAEKILDLGLKCTKLNPTSRPKMKEVVDVLNELQKFNR